MSFTLTVVGSSAAQATLKRGLSAYTLTHEQQHYLIDCGEGTQMQLKKYKLKITRINHIFISHLHADHYLGLIGLLFTMSLNDRNKPLTVYAPRGLEAIVMAHFSVVNAKLSYPLHFVVLSSKQPEQIVDKEYLSVTAFPLKHTVPTYGFYFKEKPKPRNILKSFVEEFQPDIFAIKEIKTGADYVDKTVGRIENSKITLPPKEISSFAYCSDTAYYPKLATIINNTTALLHEATFENKDAHLAKLRYHSTAVQAAKIADMVGCKQLFLGHISSRVMSSKELEEEAKEVFENTVVVEDGMSYEI